MKQAVVLLNLGGPDSIESIEPFLTNLFSDREIFKIPFFQETIAKIIAKKRAPKSSTQYKKIGNSSPINYWTELQRKKLSEELKEFGIDVFIGMRYWKPLISETAREIKMKNYEKVLLLPLYPQYSFSTTRSSFNEWKKNYDLNNCIFVESYFNDPNYIKAINNRINQAFKKIENANYRNTAILFSAHGLPKSFIKKGDPYEQQIYKTVERVIADRDLNFKYFVSFQSKIGPVKWLKPSTIETIKIIAKNEINNLIVVPISFVSDHIETLFEIDIEYRKFANSIGIKNFVITEGLNDMSEFILALKFLTINYLNLKYD